jgi:hypothetical protein
MGFASRNFFSLRPSQSTERDPSGKKITRSFALIIIFLLVGFFLISQPSKNFILKDIKYVKIAGQSIRVDLALTTTEQQKGLGGRNELKENEGMLFIFDWPGEYYFWMKGMNFPIDIIWLAPSGGGDGEDTKVVYIKKNAQPEAFPPRLDSGEAGLETYGPDINAKYVLEIVAGFSDKNNLKVGDNVLFTY